MTQKTIKLLESPIKRLPLVRMINNDTNQEIVFYNDFTYELILTGGGKSKLTLPEGVDHMRLRTMQLTMVSDTSSAYYLSQAVPALDTNPILRKLTGMSLQARNAHDKFVGPRVEFNVLGVWYFPHDHIVEMHKRWSSVEPDDVKQDQRHYVFAEALEGVLKATHVGHNVTITSYDALEVA